MKHAIIAAAICFIICTALPAGQATRVEITDKVLVEDTVRFGINLGGDTYYSGAVLVKKRSQQNFEGTSYRQCHFGPSQDEHGATSWFRQPQWWQDLMVEHGYYEILQGTTKFTDRPSHNDNLICEIKHFLSSSFLVRDWLAFVS